MNFNKPSNQSLSINRRYFSTSYDKENYKPINQFKESSSLESKHGEIIINNDKFDEYNDLNADFKEISSYHQKELQDIKALDSPKNNTSLKNLLKDYSSSFSQDNLSFLTSDIHKDFNKELNFRLRRKFCLWENQVELEYLGGGSYGDVHKIFDKLNRQFYAKKTLRKVHGTFRDNVALGEYKALLKILEYDSPILIKVLQLDYEPKKHFSALLEYGPGNLTGVLAYLKREGKTWTSKDILELYDQLVNQVEELKKIGICHRDIKPDNIIVTHNGLFKLTDFGLAELVQKGKQLMHIKGTPRYMHPQLREAFKIRAKDCYIDPYEADLYSIEQIMNEILADTGVTIHNLKAQHPNFVCSRKIEIYESIKEEYKIEYFDSLYEKVPKEQRFKILQTLIQYCVFSDISKYLQRKLKESRKSADAYIVYFLTGEIFRINANYSKAMIFYKRSEKHSPIHNDEQAGALYHSMGVCEFCVDSYESSKKYHLKSLEIRRTLFGEEHDSVAEEYGRLGLVELSIGSRKKSLELYDRALQIYRQNPKRNMIQINTLHRWIAVTKQWYGDYEESRYIHQNIYEQEKLIYGEKHPNTASALLALGGDYNYLQEVDKALQCFSQASKIYNEVYPSDHMQIVYLSINKAIGYEAQGDYKLALELFEKSLDVLRSKYPDVLVVQCVKMYIAGIWLKTNHTANFQEAYDYLLECRNKVAEANEKDYFYIGITQRYIGLYYLKSGQLDVALKETIKSLEICEKIKIGHIQTAYCYQQMGVIYDLQKNLKKSLECFELALNICEKRLSRNHQKTVICLFDIGKTYFNANKIQEAKEFLERCLKVRNENSKLRQNLLYPKLEDIQQYLSKITDSFEQGNLNYEAGYE